MAHSGQRRYCRLSGANLQFSQFGYAYSFLAVHFVCAKVPIIGVTMHSATETIQLDADIVILVVVFTIQYFAVVFKERIHKYFVNFVHFQVAQSGQQLCCQLSGANLVRIDS